MFVTSKLENSNRLEKYDNSIQCTTKLIPIMQLNIESLQQLYGGDNYRYNSVTDLVLNGGKRMSSLLRCIEYIDDLMYRVDFIQLGDQQFPLLECLQIHGIPGGMLSTYLHDIDRSTIEGSGIIGIDHKTRMLWDILCDLGQFSFVFKAAKSENSRTSNYMSKVGFKEKQYGALRCFYNRNDYGVLFRSIMSEFISFIEQNSSNYKFDLEKFSNSKDVQRNYAISMIGKM